ncbi:hypothetical protein [Ideonella sp. A 288]|uniref:hypothetical protein n=1 Tax=Ideonella sp. A 288 TaxID=1962181 RepID=UPI000B4B255F|nr:hypothetical protein [Ideonella sp. A 288]
MEDLPDESSVAKRQTASIYLKELAEIGILREHKVGTEGHQHRVDQADEGRREEQGDVAQCLQCLGAVHQGLRGGLDRGGQAGEKGAATMNARPRIGASAGRAIVRNAPAWVGCVQVPVGGAGGDVARHQRQRRAPLAATGAAASVRAASRLGRAAIGRTAGGVRAACTDLPPDGPQAKTEIRLDIKGGAVTVGIAWPDKALGDLAGVVRELLK